MRKGFAVLICLSLLALMTSCGGSSDDSSGGNGGGPFGGPGGGNNSPVARITSPDEGIIFTVGEVIQFAGSCNDSEDGALTGASLVWTSDLDGQIDTGATCSSTALSVGAHQITLTATDSDGSGGMDTVAITVNPAPASGNLPDTGQTTSYTDTPGEDSDYSINPPSYTKLARSGNALNAGATDWAMVRDNVTGLIWEVKTDDNSIHDKDNTYTWYNARNVFIARLNSDYFGGHADWRLPTIKELSTLVNMDAHPIYINTAYFPRTKPFVYLSSTAYNDVTDGVWTVHSYDGSIIADSGTRSFNVRAVLGIQRSSNLIDNSDGTVTDTNTGLMWQQAEAGLMTWEAALAYCETLVLAGHDDWRLPNRNELQSIVDYETYGPSIDTVFFPDTEWAAYYWSSTTCAYRTDVAWWVHFYDGSAFYFLKSTSYNVRAVRGGQ